MESCGAAASSGRVGSDEDGLMLTGWAARALLDPRRLGRAGRHDPVRRVHRTQPPPVPDPVSERSPACGCFETSFAVCELRKWRPCSNHIPLRPPSAASWVRTQLASSLRSRKPYSVNLLLGGYDPTSSTPSLYWIDYLGTLATVPYAAHGYGAYFSLSTMDRWHDPEGDLEAGLELLRKCIKELEVRFIVNLGGWTIRGA